jgi:hypothetical protein
MATAQGVGASIVFYGAIDCINVMAFIPATVVAGINKSMKPLIVNIMTDYIPGSDAGFDIWQDNLMKIVKVNATAWTIAAADVTSIEVYQAAWVSKFATARNPAECLNGDKPEKTDARSKYEKELRQFIQHNLATNSKVSIGDRERMGITVPTGTRTRVPVPTTSPIATIDFSIRLQHSIGFADESGHGKGKPEGVHGCEIWIKLGDAPKDLTELSFVAISTKSPHVREFEVADVGKIAHYRLRWINPRGEEGPWGSEASAIVVG